MTTSQPPPMSALTDGDPAQVGPFQVHGTLGAGGMGVVYGVTDADGRWLALKLIRGEFTDDREFRGSGLIHPGEPTSPPVRLDVAAADQTITPERCPSMAYSEPYAQLRTGFVAQPEYVDELEDAAGDDELSFEEVAEPQPRW